MNDSDFALLFGPGETQQTYRVTARSVAGTATGLFRIPPALQEGSGLLEELRQASSHPQDSKLSPEERAGTELFHALFHEPLLGLLDSGTARLESRPHPGLNLRLHFAVEGQDLARLDSLPWELLRDPRTGSPFNRQLHPIVHSVATPRPARPLTLSLPLRVLAIIPHSAGSGRLAVDRDLRLLQSELRIDVTVLEPSTPLELLGAVQGKAFQILHFMGHGVFDATLGQSDLPGSAADPRPVGELGALLRNARDLRLVVLNGCSTSHGQSNEIASELVKSGLPAVVTMRCPISDRAASAFSHSFYKHLAAGDPLEAAVDAGRSAIVHEEPREWALPTVYVPFDADSQKRDRYAELVDKKFRSSLTGEENVELLQLEADLDEADSRFYEPIERKLEMALTKLRQRSQTR